MWYSHKDILEDIVSISWLYEKIFWKLLNKLVFKVKFENQKTLLKTVYNYNDIDQIFEKQIERKEFNKLSKIIFRFNENNQNGIFWSRSNNNSNNNKN